MNHGPSAFSSFGWVEGTALIGGVLALILFIVWIYRRSELQGNGLTIQERRTLDRPECEILSMLRQFGTPIPQARIVEQMPGDFEHVLEVIHDLEAKGLVHRIWDPDTKELNIAA